MDSEEWATNEYELCPGSVLPSVPCGDAQKEMDRALWAANVDGVFPKMLS